MNKYNSTRYRAWHYWPMFVIAAAMVCAVMVFHPLFKKMNQKEENLKVSQPENASTKKKDVWLPDTTTFSNKNLIK